MRILLAMHLSAARLVLTLHIIVATISLRMQYQNCFDTIADGHTALNTPDLFRPPKLSGAGPG